MTRIDPAVVRRQRLRNRVHGLVLLLGMVATLALCAAVLFGSRGLVWVVILGVGSLALRPRVRPAWVLRMYRARRVPAAAAPDLHALVTALARRAGLANVPALYLSPTRMLNAFAVGDPEDAAIAVTDGLLRRLDGRQLAGVLAHEISHIRSGDLRMMMLADAIGRLTHAIAYAGLAMIFLFGVPMLMGAGGADLLLVGTILLAVPTVVTLLQLALSRAREYDADLAAVALTGDPLGMAAALETLHRHEGRLWERVMVPHRRSPDALLLQTHPPAEERIRRLRALDPTGGEPLAVPADPGPPPGFGVPVGPVRLRAPGIWR